MSYDKRTGMPDMLDEPAMLAPIEGREAIPAGQDLVKWIRVRSGELKATRVWITAGLYKEYRVSHPKRSPSEIWHGGNGMCVVVCGHGLEPCTVSWGDKLVATEPEPKPKSKSKPKSKPEPKPEPEDTPCSA